MEFNTELIGVRTKFGDKVLISLFDKQANECTCIDETLVHSHVVSRSTIVDSDNAIEQCASIVRAQLDKTAAKKIRQELNNYAQLQHLFGTPIRMVERTV